MATELNKEIFDTTILLNLDLARLDASTSKDVLKLLRNMQRELIESLGSEDLTTWGRRRLNQQLNEANEIIKRYYSDIEAVTLAATQGIAPVVATSTAGSIAVAMGGADAVKRVGVRAGLLPTTNYMEALAGNAVIQGATQGEWWAKQSLDMQFRYAQAVKQGLVAAETNQQIIKRIKDIKGITDQNAEKLVRTSVMTVANAAREKTVDQNLDVIAAVEYSGTMDSKICTQCAPVDNLRWDAKTHEPIGHSIPYLHLPQHPNCRCSYIPVTKTYRELGIDMDEFKQGERASIEGFVTDKTVEDFMNRKGKKFTEELLGVGRAELYLNGTIKFEQLIDGRGQPLTLKQLQDKYS